MSFLQGLTRVALVAAWLQLRTIRNNDPGYRGTGR